MGSCSKIQAVQPKTEVRTETQYERIDLYVKIFFNILDKDSEDNIDTESQQFYVTEGIDMRIIRDEISKDQMLFDGNNISIVIQTDDLICGESGAISDPIGKFLKVLEAIDEIYDFLYKKINILFANIHFVVYGFEIIEDVIRGLLYLIDEDEGLNVTDDSFASFIIGLDDPFAKWKENNWFFYVDYIGIIEYYQLFHPKFYGTVSQDGVKQSIRINETESENIIEKEETDLVPIREEGEVNDKRYFCLSATKYAYVGDWLSDLQNLLDWIEIVPGVSEVSSLINGFVYLGRMTKACYEWDEEKTAEYQKKALLKFCGAIPGSSVVKGVVKVHRAVQTVRLVQTSERTFKQAQLGVKKSKQALNRIRQKKTTRRKKGKAKTANREAYKEKSKAQKELNEAIVLRDQQIRESGLTLKEINQLSRGILSNPLEYYKSVMKSADNVILQKVSTTTEDIFIDSVFSFPANFKHISKGINAYQSGDYEKAITEFAAIKRNIAVTNMRYQNLDSENEWDIFNKVVDKKEEKNEERRNKGK